MDIERPGYPDETIYAIVIFNRVTHEVRLHEALGQSMDDYVDSEAEEGNEVDVDALIAIFEQEARKWATVTNQKELADD